MKKYENILRASLLDALKRIGARLFPTPALVPVRAGSARGNRPRIYGEKR